MNIKIELNVKSCRDCFYSTNSSIEHNDPFISAPYPTEWWCRLKDHSSFDCYMPIEDPSKIHDKCIFNKNPKQGE